MLDRDIESASERWKAVANRPRWMLVDDTPAILEAVAMLLEALDCAEVCKFTGAAEALEAFAAEPGGFELVVTDFNMPGMNGAELCQANRALAPEQKVLLATGSSEITEREAVEFGFCGMLKKPFPFRALMEVVEQLGLRRTEMSGGDGEEVLAELVVTSEAWAAA